MMTNIWKIVIPGAGLVAGIACGTPRDTMRDTLTADPAAATPTAMEPMAPSWSDQQLAWAFMDANSTDSAAGAQAQRLATRADVRAYGERMMRDHGEKNRLTRDLLSRLAITPTAPADSASRGHDMHLMRTQLDTTAAFDATYLRHAVSMHEGLLQKLDNTLIPQAKHAELKAHFEKARPGVAEHLKQAEKLSAATAMQ